MDKPSVENLLCLFPALPANVVFDVVDQYQGDTSQALDALLVMGGEEPSPQRPGLAPRPLVPPPPVSPADLQAVFFPQERLCVPPLLPLPPIPVEAVAEVQPRDDSLSAVAPWLVMEAPAAVATDTQHSTARHLVMATPVQAVGVTPARRTWWSAWPLDAQHPARSDHPVQPSSSTCVVTLNACYLAYCTSPPPPLVAYPASGMSPPPLHPGTDPGGGRGGGSAGPNTPTADLAAVLPQLAPYLTSADHAAALASSAPAPSLPSLPALVPEPVPALVAIPAPAPLPMPILLSKGALPSASGSSSGTSWTEDHPNLIHLPTWGGGKRAEDSGAGHECYSPTSLIEAVEFHQEMIPNLKKEVIADVLQRHNRQAALEQLLMLSACVEEAARGAEVPDSAAWDFASSTGSEGHASELGGAGSYGTRSSGGSEEHTTQLRPPSGAAEDLTLEEKVGVLRAEVAGFSSEEISSVLSACNGQLAAATELLRAMASGGGGSSASVAAVAVAHSQGNELLHAPMEEAAPPAADPRLCQLLAARFPDVPAEGVSLVLALCANSLPAAAQMLQEQGSRGELMPVVAAPGGLAAAVPLHTPLALPTSLVLDGGLSGLSLSEATHHRNQAIFKEEHSKEEQLRAYYCKCFELAQEAYNRGDKAMAATLSTEGRCLKAEYEQEQGRAHRRISKRVNSGNLSRITVDLHCQHADKALAMVREHLHLFPSTIPGGVVVRYITGKGLHSGPEGPRIRPAVIALLKEQEVPYVDGAGWVEATIIPTDEE